MQDQVLFQSEAPQQPFNLRPLDETAIVKDRVDGVGILRITGVSRYGGQQGLQPFGVVRDVREGFRGEPFLGDFSGLAKVGVPLDASDVPIGLSVLVEAIRSDDGAVTQDGVKAGFDEDRVARLHRAGEVPAGEGVVHTQWNGRLVFEFSEVAVVVPADTGDTGFPALRPEVGAGAEGAQPVARACIFRQRGSQCELAEKFSARRVDLAGATVGGLD